MLKKEYRLPAKARLNDSSSLNSSSYRLMITKNNLPVSRFGFIINKRIDKRSTVRNRIKRLIRSCIEEMLPKIKTGYDMLFIIRKNVIDRKRITLYDEIENLFNNHKLLI